MNLIYCRNKSCFSVLLISDMSHWISSSPSAVMVQTSIPGELEKLQKPLQWHVCQLYVNELPLRHLLIHIDGATSGPRAFTDKIGKAISTCEKLPIVVFTPLESDLPPMIAADLSTNQKYLYDICGPVSKGFCSVPLSRRNPGTPSHLRWLTAANRLLRLYV